MVENSHDKSYFSTRGTNNYYSWYDNSGEPRRNDIDKGKPKTLKKPVTVPLCPPKIQHGLTRAQTRTCSIWGRQLTAWAMVRPAVQLNELWKINIQIKIRSLLAEHLGPCMWIGKEQSNTILEDSSSKINVSRRTSMGRAHKATLAPRTFLICCAFRSDL